MMMGTDSNPAGGFDTKPCLIARRNPTPRGAPWRVLSRLGATGEASPRAKKHPSSRIGAGTLATVPTLRVTPR
jgi:hypothetical protein